MRRILILDNNRENVEMLSRHLAEGGHSLQIAGDLDSALHRVRAWKPHFVLLNTNVPGLEGEDIISRIRQASPEDYMIVVVMFPGDGGWDLRFANSGADDYLAIPYRPQDLTGRIHAMIRVKEVHDSLKRALHRIEELTVTDELTGLMSMRVVYRRGEEEITRSRKNHAPMAAMLLNLDGFSGVNQSYGFMVGTRVLQEVASRLKQCLRSQDLVARVGADEFFVLLPETDVAAAGKVAESILDRIKATPFKSEKVSIALTACLGLGGLLPEHSQRKMSDLLQNTTEALRSAKAGGPNRIEVYSFT